MMTNHIYSTTGDQAVFEAFILSCVPVVERLARKYAASFPSRLIDFDDYVSVGMLRICAKVSTIVQVKPSPLNYACQVAQSAMIDEYRRLHPSRNVLSLNMPQGDNSDLCLADLLPDRSSPARKLRTRRESALQRALLRLTKKQRAALRRRRGLVGYGPHSLKEAARSMHAVSSGAVRHADMAGLRRLRADTDLRRVVLGEVEA